MQWPSIVCISLIIIYPFITPFCESWVRSANGFELGNRRRVISVLKLEIAMTVLNIFIYHQLLVYFNPEKGDRESDRRRLMIWRKRSSISLIVFFIFAQLIYFLYYAPTWLQWMFFDIADISCGIWTNLLAFVCGFFLVNLLREPFMKVPPLRYSIELASQVNVLKELIFCRRSQIKFTVCITLVLSFVMWAGCDYVRVKERTIPIENLSASGGRLRLAMISDIHAGASVYKEQVDLVVDRLLSLDVDAVVIVGDMVDGPVEDIKERVSPFWQVPRRFPTFFVTGNHEYYYGNVMEWINLYEKHNIHVLNNNHTMLNGVCLAGVNDISSGKMGISGHYMNASIALRKCPPHTSRVLLAHNPATVKEIPRSDLETIDLMLSGHTHAGQFYVVVPAVYWMLPYYYGLYDLPYGKLMVSAGTLYQGPNMKMLGMSEIWVVNLVRK